MLSMVFPKKKKKVLHPMLDLSFNSIVWPLNRFDNHLCIKVIESASITVAVEAIISQYPRSFDTSKS